MKSLVVVYCIAIAVNVAAGVTNFGSGNTSAGIAWLAAALWCISCLVVESKSSSWKNLANDAIDAFGAHLGRCVECRGKIKMDGEGEDVQGSKDALEGIPGPIVDSLRGIVECTKEALHYICQGSLEFAVSHNGVDMKISISEEDVEKWKREHAVKEEVDGDEKAKG